MNEFTATLLKWYESHKRELPWRDTSNPYRIWISEIILQQTRVAQGYDYYLRFIKRFPDVHTLAEADEDEVLKYWEGLGYYSRARNLHAAARSIKGEFPRTYEEVRALKGVGEYTAAAICSMAYHMPYAVVDGNVYRVLARYFGIDNPIDSSEGKKLFAALAQEMLSPACPGTYNQAIMDFGAIQCTPQSPACLLCPLAEGCASLREGNVTRLPVKGRKTQVTPLYYHYLYISAGCHTFIYKRTMPGIWRNLYEFPLIEADAPLTPEELTSHPDFLHLIPQEETQALHPLCPPVRHLLSHRAILANFYQIELPEETLLPAPYLKVKKSDLAQYAVPRLTQNFIRKHIADR